MACAIGTMVIAMPTFLSHMANDGVAATNASISQARCRAADTKVLVAQGN